MVRAGAPPRDEARGFADDQRRFFDELITTQWASYDNPVWDATRVFEVDRLFERVAPRRVLDVGCGCGYHDVLMAAKPGVEEVVGIDYSEKSIEAANRAYPHPKVRRSVADIFHMPPGEFDLSVSFQVIEHVRDAAGFLAACARQVRPGGWVAAVTPNRVRLSNRLRTALGRTPVLVDPLHYREFSAGELREVGRAFGLACPGGFAYGLSVVVPRLNRAVVPASIGRRLGYLIPPVADCLCLIFEVGPRP